jgi:3D (Asp-Asp-Asp) domain-containing protein
MMRKASFLYDRRKEALVALHPMHGKIPSQRRANIVPSLTLAFTLAMLGGATVAGAQQQTPTPATHEVVVTVDGESREIVSSAKTVGDLLKQYNIPFGDLDRCSVPLATRLKDGLMLTISRVHTEVVTEKTPIPFKTRETYSGDLRVGTRQIKTPGKKGEKAVTYRVYYKDGKPTEKVKLAVKVTPPRTEVAVLGLRGMTLASRSALGGRRILEMNASAYGPGGNGHWGMTTAMGIRPRYGIVAVDPRVIRLGTRLYVEGYGPALAADTGGAIKGMRIDLFYPTDRQAYAYGRKRVKVMVLG